MKAYSVYSYAVSKNCTLTLSIFILFLYLLAPGAYAMGEKQLAKDSTSRENPEAPRITGDPRQKILKNKLLFPSGKVLVSLPKQVRAFTVEEYTKHYGLDVKPEYAFIDDSTDSRFSVSVTPSNLEPSGLEAYRIRMEKALAKSVKELVWIKREMLKFGETEWAHLEMQNQTTDGSTVMNDFYVTSMGGHPLMFSVMTNTKYWYDMRKVMQKMMLSVTVQDLPETSDK
jgi:hypothetical protein